MLWQIAYAPYVSDYSRYMSPDKGVRAVFWYSYTGVVLGSAAPMMIGALVGLVSTSSNLVAEIDKLTGNFGWLVMIVFVVGIIDTNAINAYGGMLCSITAATSASAPCRTSTLGGAQGRCRQRRDELRLVFSASRRRVVRAPGGLSWRRSGARAGHSAWASATGAGLVRPRCTAEK